MTDAISLIVLVATGEAADITTRSMTRAMNETLGANAHVVVHETSGDPSDAEALAVEHRESADAVVEIVWTEGHHRQVTLRVHLARSHRWLERSIGFRLSDADTERGRALGFAIASILPERSDTTPEASPAPSSSGQPPPPAAPAVEPPAEASPKAPPVPATTPGTAPEDHPAPATTPQKPATTPQNESASTAPAPASPSPTSPPAPSTAPATAISPSPSSAGTSAAPPTSRPARSVSSPANDALPRVAVDLEATAAFASPSSGFGPEAAVQWFVPPISWLSLRLAAGARFGRADMSSEANGSATFAWTEGFASAGIALHPLRASPGRPFGCSIRGDFSSTYVWISAPPGTRAEAASRNANGAPDIVAGVTWQIGPHFDILAAAGASYSLFPTQLTFGGRSADVFSRWRLLANAGIGAEF